MDDEHLPCPFGMDRRLYTTLRKSFDKAVARLGMSTLRKAKEATVARNRVLVDRERSCLKGHLQAFKVNQHIQESLAKILAKNDATATQVFALLREVVEKATRSETKLDLVLSAVSLWSATASSSASGRTAAIERRTSPPRSGRSPRSTAAAAPSACASFPRPLIRLRVRLTPTATRSFSSTVETTVATTHREAFKTTN
jgi:hypothetical protein